MLLLTALQPSLPGTHIEVHSDLLAAARALWGQEPGAAIPYRTSTVNFVADATVANLSVVPTPAFSGQPICTFSNVPAFHLVDLVGWFVA